MTEQRRGQRWLTVWNVSDEVIPAFAAMQLTGESPKKVYHRAIFAVIKPDLFTERRQDPNSLVINSEQPIPPGSYGLGTQDYPARALWGDSDGTEQFLGSDDQLASVVSYGPVHDKWYLVAGGTAYSSLGQAWIGNSEEDQSRNRTIWVTPHPIPRIARFTVGTHSRDAFTGIRVIGAGEAIALVGLDDLFIGNIDGRVPSIVSGQGNGITSVVDGTADGNGLKFRISGLYQFGFGGSITNPDPASANSMLRLQLTINGVGTPWACGRVNAVGLALPDQTPTPTTESVSLVGLMAIAAGDEIHIVNSGAYAVTIDLFHCWFMKLAPS